MGDQIPIAVMPVARSEREAVVAPMSEPLRCRWSIALLGTTVFVVAGHLMIKAGLNGIALSGRNDSIAHRLGLALVSPLVLEGLATYLLGSLCWMVAVAQKDLSFLYPLTSLNYVLVVVASAALFGESVSAQRALGVVLIVGGALLMNREARAEEP